MGLCGIPEDEMTQPTSMKRPALPGPRRREALREALQASADMLYRRRASDIPEGYIDDYVALNWLEWHGGDLKLTPLGQAICRDTGTDVGGADALAPPERAELSRQGAKAAARGDMASTNPMDSTQNGPAVTGESQERWTERSDAWLAGHDLQSGTASPAQPGRDKRGDGLPGTR
jgi:hypothetical protein